MRYLQAWEEKKIIRGKLAYHEPSGAMCQFRLKKQFINQFPDLRSKSGKFLYEVIPFLYWDVLMDFLKRAKEDGKVPPSLLWIAQE